MKKFLLSLVLFAGASVSASSCPVGDEQRSEIFVETCLEAFGHKNIDSWLRYSEKSNSVILGGKTLTQKGFAVLDAAVNTVATGAAFFGAINNDGNLDPLNILSGLAGIYKVCEGGIWVYRYFTATDVALEGTLALTPEHIILPKVGTFKWEAVNSVRLVQPDTQNQNRRIAFDLKGGRSFEWAALNPHLMEHAATFINLMINKLNNLSTEESSITRFKRAFSNSFTTPASERFVKNFARSPLQGKMIFIGDQKPFYAERFNQGLLAGAAAVGLTLGAAVETRKGLAQAKRRAEERRAEEREGVSRHSSASVGRAGLVFQAPEPEFQPSFHNYFTAGSIGCGVAAVACGAFAAVKFFRTVFGNGIMCSPSGFMITGHSFCKWSDLQRVEVLESEKVTVSPVAKGKLAPVKSATQSQTVVFYRKDGERIRWDKCPQEIVKNMEVFVNMLIENNVVEVTA